MPEEVSYKDFVLQNMNLLKVDFFVVLFPYVVCKIKIELVLVP